jgi:hypothetical protein
MSAVMLRPWQVFFTSRQVVMHPALRRAALLGGLVVALTGLVAVSAASAARIALDAPDNGRAPLIAHDSSSQTTYVVWEDPVKPAVDLCILPAGATGCEGGTPVLLEDSLFTGDNFSGPGGVVVLPGGEGAVIGNTTENGSIAWISPAGGAAFLSSGQGLQNGGEPISNVSLFYTVGNAVALSSTDVGLLDDYGDKFADTSLTALAPKIEAPNTNQTTPEGEFSRKALGSIGPEIAAEPAPPPAAPGTDLVVGVGDNFGGPSVALPGCLNSSGSGFGVSAGLVNGTSKAVGTLNAKGLPAYGVLACSAETPVLAQGGADGIGVIENEGDGLDGAGELVTVDYRPFVATSTGGTFGAPVQLADVSHVASGGVGELDLADDSGTGVYATWKDGQGLVLDFSGTGGASWNPPAVVPEPTNSPQNNPVIVGIGGGNAEIAYESNPGTGTQVFLESVNYAAIYAADNPPPSTKPAPPPPPPPAPSSEFKVEAIVSSSGGTVTITIVVTQSGKATLEFTVSTSSLAHSAAVDAKAKKCKHGQIKLKGKCVPANTVVGKTSANATAGVPLKLTVHLSNKIKALLKRGKTVHLAGTLTFQSALGGKPTTHTYNLTVKGSKPKHKK